MKSELEKVFQMENIYSGVEFWKIPEPVFVDVYGAQESIPGILKRFTYTGSAEIAF